MVIRKVSTAGDVGAWKLFFRRTRQGSMSGIDLSRPDVLLLADQEAVIALTCRPFFGLEGALAAARTSARLKRLGLDSSGDPAAALPAPPKGLVPRWDSLHSAHHRSPRRAD